MKESSKKVASDMFPKKGSGIKAVMPKDAAGTPVKQVASKMFGK